MNRKLIFLDIDGTLTVPGHNEPPESAVRAIAEARERGHLVYLCTGRNYDMMKPLLAYGFDGYIASSGGYVVCADRVIFDCPMTEQQRDAAMQTLEKNGIFRTVECRDGSYTDEGFKQFLRDHASEEGNSEMLRWREQIEKELRIVPMSRYDCKPIYKIVMMSPSVDRIYETQKALGEDFLFCIQNPEGSGFINGEVLLRAFDKGKAVKRVCEYLQIPVEDTIGFGDSMNDKEMMEAVGISICMGNGSPEIQKMADEVCPAVTEDGLRQAFLKHQLIGQEFAE